MNHDKYLSLINKETVPVLLPPFWPGEVFCFINFVRIYYHSKVYKISWGNYNLSFGQTQEVG
jgi:hypothetical protein